MRKFMETELPPRGASRHYIGERGVRYFEYQRHVGFIAGRLNVTKFSGFIRPFDTVVDFGCGGGYLLASLQCARKLGVDVNPVARDIATGNGVEFHSRLEEIQDGTADTVISNHALEHVLAPIDSLRGIFRILRPGGKLVLCLPLDDWRRQKRYSPADINHHLHTWTPLLIGHLLFEAGFVVKPEEIRVLRSAWPRYYPYLSQWCPDWLFRFTCLIWSILAKRRQVLAVAHRPS